MAEERQTGSTAPSTDPNVVKGLPLTHQSDPGHEWKGKSGAIKSVHVESIWNSVT